jgi:hypothetical protein
VYIIFNICYNKNQFCDKFNLKMLFLIIILCYKIDFFSYSDNSYITITISYRNGPFDNILV